MPGRKPISASLHSSCFHSANGSALLQMSPMAVDFAHPPQARDPQHTVEEVRQDYGAEIFGWMLATLSSDTDAADAFSLFSEDLWKSLARHQGRCSMRTWCYMLARCAVSRVLEARAGGRTVALSDAPISGVAPQVREATLSYLRTDVKRRVRSLREQLDPDDQMLLVLRVDKDLGWRDIAIVL